jgi:uncharacterized protein YbjT (DUF2867 family)
VKGDNTKPVVAVIGATGGQGGGLARAILNDTGSPFAVRAVTRNTESERATALRELGADLVAADLDDVDSLVAAFHGAHGAYCVTNFWEHFSPEKELQQAANLAEAARRTELGHVIWSTLEDTRELLPIDDPRMPTLMGNYNVPHFDSKGASNSTFTDSGVPTTFLLTSFYWENFIELGSGPHKGPDGAYALALPLGDKKLPGIARADIGRCAYGIFKRGTDAIGRTIGIAGEHLTGPEMAAAFSEALSIEVQFNDVPPDVYRTFDFPGADDITNMYQYQNDFNEEFCAARDVDQARALNPELQTFAAWLAGNKDRIPL